MKFVTYKRTFILAYINYLLNILIHAIPISKDVLPEPKYQVVWLDEPRSQTEPTNRPEINEPKTCDSFEYSQRNPFLGKVIGSSRVTPDEHFQDVRWE